MIVLALPLFSLAVSCLFAWLVSLITSRMRNTTAITTALSVVFMLAYFLFGFRMNSYVTQLAANGAAIAGALGSAAPLVWLGRCGREPCRPRADAFVDGSAVRAGLCAAQSQLYPHCHHTARTDQGPVRKKGHAHLLAECGALPPGTCPSDQQFRLYAQRRARPRVRVGAGCSGHSQAAGTSGGADCDPGSA